jgi:hypothetical protein
MASFFKFFLSRETNGDFRARLPQGEIAADLFGRRGRRELIKNFALA